jgi:hypothetical protein
MENPHRSCLNCNHDLEATYRFCPSCGQETRDTERSLGDFLHHFAKDYFTFDSKIIKSFKPLVFNPGFLTREFFAGKRATYIPPLRMYLFVSIMFFLILSWLTPSSDEQFTEEAFWDDFFGSWLPKLFFILLPAFAGILWALYFRKKESYLVHFIFSLHYHSFLFVSTLAYLLLSEILVALQLQSVNLYLSFLLAATFLVYLFFGLRRMYSQSFGKTMVKFLLVCTSYGLILAISVTLALILFLSNEQAM